MKDILKLPFIIPTLGKYYDNLIYDLKDVFEKQIFVDGKNVDEFESFLSKRYNKRKVIGVSSGTTGLILALDAILKEKKEVIVPGISFTATIQSIIHAGGIPIFADILKDTWNLDPEDVKNKITTNTGAIMPVNLFGVPCNIKAFEELSEQKKIPIIYDSCQAFGAKTNFGEVGNFGDIEVFSLDVTKILSGVLGGFIVVKDDEVASKIRMSKNFGHNKSKIPLVKGINGRMHEYSAILAKYHLRDFDKNFSILKKNISIYKDLFKDFSNIKLQNEGKDISSPQYFGLYIDIDNIQIVKQIKGLLEKEGIETRIYNLSNLHKNPIFNSQETYLRNTEKMNSKILCLPIHEGVKEEHMNKIKEIIQEVLR